MKVSPLVRALLLAADVVALAGVVAFSALAAFDSEKMGYVVAQIVCAVVVLVSVLLLNQGSTPPGDA